MATIAVGQSVSDLAIIWWACGLVLVWAGGMWWSIRRNADDRPLRHHLW